MKSPGHLAWIRTLSCHCGDNTSTQAAHIRFNWPDKDDKAGTGLKPGDQWVVPLCSRHHQIQHDIGEKVFWRNQSINPVLYSRLLWDNSGNTDKAFEIIDKVKKGTLSEL